MFALGSILMLGILIVSALTVGYLINRYWLRAATGARANHSGLPACGSCGYPARGIDSLNCPECGADLRVVGIVRPGEQNRLGFGCLLIPGFSIAAFVVAGILYAYLTEQVLPTRLSDETTEWLEPVSAQYSRADLTVHSTHTFPAGFHTASSLGLTASSNYSSVGQSSVTIGYVTQTVPTAQFRTERIYIDFWPKQAVTFQWLPPRVEIDSATGTVTWTDRQGKVYPPDNNFTDQEMLAVLNDLGADTSRPEVVAEAQELNAILKMLANGPGTHTTTSFSNPSSMSGGSYGVSPPWFIWAYVSAWLVIWIAGILLIVRRMRKRLPK